MDRYWIGDFRCKALELIYKEKDSEEHVHFYLYDDFADCNWFATEGATNLQIASPSSASIIIMTGLADCIQSCLWSSVDIKKTAKKYAEIINGLMESYSMCNFHFCSVMQVDKDYYSSFASSGYVTASALNKKIDDFNTTIQECCNAIYINSNQYLKDVGYTTFDGIRYDNNTYLGIYAYIISCLQEGTGSSIIPRFTAPTIEGAGENSDADTSDDYWINTGHGGLSPFSVQGSHGSTLPNCVAYAWGRFYEITGTRPTVLTANAECWFAASRTLDSDWDTMAASGTKYDGYERGTTPRPGAIICWQKGIIGDDPTISDNSGDAGHVAIVEQVNEDGTIITSESGYQSSFFWLKKRRSNGAMSVEYDATTGKIVEKSGWSNTGENSWGAGSPYKFQGFIYSPSTAGTTGNIARTVSKDMVTSNNTSLGTNQLYEDLSNVNQISEAMKTNALYIWQYLGNLGWSMNAVAGLLGNLMAESTINPGRWQNGAVNVGPAYGLAQWDPFSKIVNWQTSKGYELNDIDGQLQKILDEVEIHGKSWDDGRSQWITKDSYNISFKDFTTSTKDAAWLAGAFLINYERPKDQTVQNQKNRGRNATYWFDYLRTNSEGGYAQKFSVDGFKTDKVTPSFIAASFVVTKGRSYTYELIRTKKSCASGSGTIEVKEDEAEISSVITLELTKNIRPSAKYTLKITVLGEFEDDKYEESIEIITPPSLPKSASNVSFVCLDEFKDANSRFSFSATKPNDLGYWKSKYGYEEVLIVNGEVKKTLPVKTFGSTSFTIKDRYGYTCKTGDTVQIGARVWTQDDDGKTWYDDQKAKTSDTICLLNKTINTYLTLD